MTRPSSYPTDVVLFGSDETALRLDATGSPQWGDDQVVYIRRMIRLTSLVKIALNSHLRNFNTKLGKGSRI